MIHKDKNYRYRIEFNTPIGVYYTNYTHDSGENMLNNHHNIINEIHTNKDISVNIDGIETHRYITLINTVLLNSVILLRYEEIVEDTNTGD